MSHGAGGLRDLVAFDVVDRTPDGLGGHVPTPREVLLADAEMLYMKGAEAEQAGRLTGTAKFKVRIRSSGPARALTADHVMRDVRRGITFNVREVDAITDPAWVWIVAEAGVAT